MKMSMLSFDQIFAKKNVDIAVKIITLLVIGWIIMIAIPSLFVSLFDTIYGNIVLIGITVLAGLYNINIGFIMAIVFMILFRFSHMSINM